MKIDLYQIDAFADHAFHGNPAAVCPLPSWLPDELMQSIAAENNLSETAFFVPDGNGYSIRWFTPVAEVDLCGHATLASAFVLFNELGFSGDTVTFDSRSGMLPVSRDGERLVLDFPAQPPTPCPAPKDLVKGLGVAPVECLKAVDYVVVLDSAEAVEAATPNFELFRNTDSRGIIITAEADEYDFVARFFAPGVGIPEDPVTGSAYTKLVPYWAGKLRKSVFRAKQVSARGGELVCELAGNRVLIAGTAVKYLQGQIDVDTEGVGTKPQGLAACRND